MKELALWLSNNVPLHLLLLPCLFPLDLVIHPEHQVHHRFLEHCRGLLDRRLPARLLLALMGDGCMEK